MNTSPEKLRLQATLTICQQHAQVLEEVLQDLSALDLTPEQLKHLSKLDCRLLDQFAYRYLRLQDDMGARFIPAILADLAEPIATMSAIDRYNRLEQLGWLPSTAEWNELRRIHNAFAHDYPESAEERYARLSVAFEAAKRLIVILNIFHKHIVK